MAYSNTLKNEVILFVTKYGLDIANAIVGTGLYFEGVVGQKCLESGYGGSQLTKNYNNFGGIRYTSNMPSDIGSVMLKGAGDSSPRPYATFPTPLRCFQYYVSILSDPNKNYAAYGVFSASSGEDQVTKIVKAGYSTTPASRYLSYCRGAIEAARDIYQLGRPMTSADVAKL